MILEYFPYFLMKNNLQNNLENHNQPNSSWTMNDKRLWQYASERVKRGIRLTHGTYAKFIKKCKRKQMNTTQDIEKHHILPRHAKGTDDPSNIVLLGKRDHILAHLLRFLEFGEYNDWKAYVFRKAVKVNLRTHGQMIAAKQRLECTGFYNSALQSLLGKRGGVIGGSRKTLNQQTARNVVGKTYGRIIGLQNQSSVLQETLTNKILVFKHKSDSNPNRRFLVSDQPGAIDVARELTKQCEDLKLPYLNPPLEKIKKGGPFYNLLKKKRPSAYGWVLLEIIKFDASDNFD